jgi:hypothetical protein
LRRRYRLGLGAAVLLVAAAMLGAALRPSPLLSLERHWLVFGAYASSAAVLTIIASSLLGKRSRAAVLGSASLLIALAALAHPVCVRIPADEVPAFESVVPLEVRAARGEPFCKLGGEWYQCKSFIARALYA